MEIAGLGVEGSRQLQQAIRDKLTQLNAYTDDVLPDYIMVLYGNGYAPNKIIDDLEAFLGLTVARQFTEWLFGHVQAMRQQLERPPQPSVSVRDETGVRPAPPKGERPREESRSMAAREESRAMDIDVPLQQQQQQQQRRRSEDRREDDLREALDRSYERQQQPSRYYRREPPANRRSYSPPPFERRSYSPPPFERRVIRRFDHHPHSPPHHHHHLHRPHPADGLEDARHLLRRPHSTGPRGGLHMDDPSLMPHHNKAPSGQAGKQQLRCAYWPNCRLGDEACPFVHPQEPCRFFPSCQHGDQCLYVHPAVPCQFGDACTNPMCNYQHGPRRALRAMAMMPMAPSVIAPAAAGGASNTILCRFHPRCVNASCPFLHPLDVPCKFGDQCRKPMCPFTHPAGHSHQLAKALVNAPCKYGKQCIRPDCAYQHPEGQSPMLAKLVSNTNATVAETGADNTNMAVEMSSSVPPSPAHPLPISANITATNVIS